MRITNRLLIIFTVTCFAIGGYLLWKSHGDENPARSGEYSTEKPLFRMSDRITTLDVQTTEEGQVFVFETPDGQRTITAEEFASRISTMQEKKEKGGWIFRIFDITSTSGVLWVTLGFIGQFLFTGRMVVQWLASEKAKRSIVPPSFWWMSLFGSSMLIIYFWWRVDVVGILGQATGWFVYIRNILLLKKAKEMIDENEDNK